MHRKREAAAGCEMINVFDVENSLNDSEGCDCGIMNIYRLTNTTYTDLAAWLPLVTLPVGFGSIRNELSLFDDNEVICRVGCKSEADIITQAGKICELLRATDISYLFLREETKTGNHHVSADIGSLMAAVLQHDSDAFSYSLLGPPMRRGWRIPAVEKRQSQAIAIYSGPSILQVSDQSKELPFATRTTGTKRKVAPKSKLERHQSILPAKVLLHPAKSGAETLVNELCELLDEIFARTEAFEEDEGDDGGILLSLAEIRSIGEDVAKLRSKNIIQNVPLDYHLRLLNLLAQHIRRANRREVDEDDDGESMNYESVMSGLEAGQISLTIMTGPSMAKQIYKEEIIDKIIEFARFQIVHSVFTAFDSGYRQIHKGPGGEELEEDDDEELQYALQNTSSSSKKIRRKLKIAAKTRKISSSKFQRFIRSTVD